MEPREDREFETIQAHFWGHERVPGSRSAKSRLVKHVHNLAPVANPFKPTDFKRNRATR
jgi:hypothetical protein